jgi:hypothetical protein
MLSLFGITKIKFRGTEIELYLVAFRTIVTTLWWVKL